MLQYFIEGFYYTISLWMIQTTLMMLDHELLGKICDGDAKNTVTPIAHQTPRVAKPSNDL
jgi:hypothetical protein